MTREEIIEKLNAILNDLHVIRDGTDNPAIEASAREMELQCHFALGHLGVVDSVYPNVLQDVS